MYHPILVRLEYSAVPNESLLTAMDATAASIGLPWHSRSRLSERDDWKSRCWRFCVMRDPPASLLVFSTR